MTPACRADASRGSISTAATNGSPQSGFLQQWAIRKVLGFRRKSRRQSLSCDGEGDNVRDRPGGALALPAAYIPAVRAAPGGKLTQYVQPLPVPGSGIIIAMPSGPDRYSFSQTQISRQLHPDLPPTPIWAYDDGSGLVGQAGSFGIAVVAHIGTPLTVS
jgi:hypothetical protein